VSSKTYIIAIAGPSCAGKSETSKAVARLLNARILSLDSYYLNLDHLDFEQRTKFNFDEPASIDHELLISHLRQLSQGQAVDAPVYDFCRYTRAAEVDHIVSAPFLILEGLFVLHWDDVRRLCDLTIYVDAPDDLCLERRKYRDVRERGRTVECVTHQYNGTVRPMAANYVWPTKDLADLVVSGTDSLDHCAQQVLDEIQRKSGKIFSPEFRSSAVVS
jgi:uridine kinase